MVAFAFFPGALAMAAEVYANLEAALRTAGEGGHRELFEDYVRQMGQLDRAAKQRLTALRQALEEPLSDAGEIHARIGRAQRSPAKEPARPDRLIDVKAAGGPGW